MCSPVTFASRVMPSVGMWRRNSASVSPGGLARCVPAFLWRFAWPYSRSKIFTLARHHPFIRRQRALLLILSLHTSVESPYTGGVNRKIFPFNGTEVTMAQPDSTNASVRQLSDPLARLLVPENVYAATFLLDRIKSTQIRAQAKPLMAKARREIRNGNVSEQTLNWLVSLQPAR